MNHPDHPTKSSSIFEHIAAEHAKMPELLNDLHRRIKGREETPAMIANAIDSLAAYLRDHFEHEDQGGFFDELATRAPRLLDRANAVSGEHIELLAGMEAFGNSARAGVASTDWWSQMELEFHRLMKELMHHEQRERELLQDAFTDEIGIGD